MNLLRRTFLNNCGATGALALVATTGLLKPGKVLAAEWNKVAFDTTTLADALKASGGVGAVASADILIAAPEHAENGMAVQFEITSKIPGTTQIIVLVDKNPRPIVADYQFTNGAEPYVFLRTKMAQTSNIRALVKAGGKTYVATKNVSVTSSGC